MAGNKKSFSMNNVVSKSFSFILDSFDFAVTFLFRIKQKFQISFISKANLGAISNITLKKIKMTISSVNFLAHQIQSITLKKIKLGIIIREIGKIQPSITIKKIKQDFVGRARQAVSSSMTIKKIKLTIFAILGTFYTLGTFDAETLGSLDSKILGEMDAVNLVGSVTITIASPAVATLTSYGLTTGDRVYISTTGALPTGLTSSVANATSTKTFYYIIVINTNTFNLATSYANAIAGTKINTSGTQSGTHTLYAVQ